MEVGRSGNSLHDALNILLIDRVRHAQGHGMRWHEPRILSYDGIHVNDHGSEVYARHIAAQLAPRLRELGSRPPASSPTAAAPIR